MRLRWKKILGGWEAWLYLRDTVCFTTPMELWAVTTFWETHKGSGLELVSIKGEK